MMEALLLGLLREMKKPDKIPRKELKKSALKKYKDKVEDKDERKKAFVNALNNLIEKEIVIYSEEDDTLVFNFEAETSDKKKRKRSKDEQMLNTNEIKKQNNNPKNPVINEVTIDKEENNISILLFYAYAKPMMNRVQHDEAISFCYKTLSDLGMTGRLRIAREGFNATLTGNQETVRKFTAALRDYSPATFGETDFKYVDHLPPNQRLKGLKVFPVTEIVTYGFTAEQAPIEKTGVHLSPVDFHQKLKDPETVVVDVRNFNETAIGKFAPKDVTAKLNNENKTTKKKSKKNTEKEEMIGAEVLDPKMRRSTEFPNWVQKNKEKLKDKQVLMYCTAGVRCERASAYLREQGVSDTVYQLQGGIHRYLEAFPDDGGFWVGKNYVFDKRFSHGANNAEILSKCVHCNEPWERYQAQAKCARCSLEVLLCRPCQRRDPPVKPWELKCDLCSK